MNFLIPSNLLLLIHKLEEKNFEVFVVGGSVRDLLLGKKVKDWDLTTNAKPEEIMDIFPDAKYNNEFGTVLIPEKYLNKKSKNKKGVFEITTYRKEGFYRDKRRPDKVEFSEKIEEDLKRRDFTINALAMGVIDVNKLLKSSSQDIEIAENQVKIVDQFDGREDLGKKLIKTVGFPEDRMEEDALRMLRAVRFAVQLGFEIDDKLFKTIKEKSKNLQFISKERIRDEFEKIILSFEPAKGVKLLIDLNLIDWFIPEILETIEVKQNHHHYHGPYNTVEKHLLASLEKCPSKKLEVRLAALLHDIGKPGTKEGFGETASFHNHEYLGARMVEKILKRLKFPKKVINKTILLIRNHMFYYNVDEVGESGVRKVVRKVGLENIGDLIDVRIADRLGSGVPKAIPYKLRHFKFMVEKVSKDPISVKQLKINGEDLIKELKMKPGPKMGAILETLLAEVIENPKINQKEKLLERAEEFLELDLKEIRKSARQKIKETQKAEEKHIKKKYRVQ